MFVCKYKNILLCLSVCVNACMVNAYENVLIH